VTGGDALQASTAVPFDEMAKRDIPVGIVEKHSFIDVFVLFFRRIGAASDRAPARSVASLRCRRRSACARSSRCSTELPNKFISLILKRLERQLSWFVFS
jgi:hypothetical protein